MANSLSSDANIRLHLLFIENARLEKLLKPAITVNVEKLEPKTDENEHLSYCSKCGALAGNNTVNKKLWCFSCNRPLIVTYKKPLQKPNPKLQGITVEEQEAFFQRQKELGLI